MTLRIGYLSDALASGARYGLARYADQVLQHLEAEGSLELCAAATNRRFRDRAHARPITFLPWGRRATALAWTYLKRPAVERWLPPVDLVHLSEPALPLATRKPWVVTVHDIGPLTHPEYFSQSRPWLMEACVRRAAREAAAIICVSQATADELQSFLQQDLGDRVQVIHEGVERAFFGDRGTTPWPQVDGMPPAGTPYLLWTGSLSPRKNLSTVVEAFERVAERVPHHLVLTGGLHWDYDALLARMQQSPYGSRIHRLGFVEESQLIELYRHADAYVYVSLLEGFGLPILEAMAGGCPVICSNRSSMPEVAGDAAVLVEPTSAEELAAALERLVSDRQAHAAVVAAGRQRAAQFDWADCARQIHGVYRRLV